jgi:hypothetical protein
VTGKRQQFLAACVDAAGVSVTPSNGSGDLIASAAAHGLVDLPADTTLAAGTMVRFLPYVDGGSGFSGGARIPPKTATQRERP